MKLAWSKNQEVQSAERTSTSAGAPLYSTTQVNASTSILQLYYYPYQLAYAFLKTSASHFHPSSAPPFKAHNPLPFNNFSFSTPVA